MNWIGSHSRVDEGATAGSCRINRLLLQTISYCQHFLNNLQHALDRFSAACNRAGIKISTKYTEVLCLSTKPRQCMRQVIGNTLQQVEKFMYLGLAFTSEVRRSARRLMHGLVKHAVLGEFYRCVATKRELSNTANLSVLKSVFVPILTYGHESGVMTERILTQVQWPNMGFLRRVHGMTKGRTEVRLCPGQETNLPPPYLNLISFGRKCTALNKKLATLLGLFGAPQ